MQDIKTEVRKKYGAIVSEASRGCCTPDVGVTDLAEYGELATDLVEGANLGLGCGVPTQFAGIRSGDTVLDLGSGAGVDVFLAAKQVGSEGHVIGVDMTPEMITRARENAVKGGHHNVEFRLGDIEDLPVDSGSIDVVLSNCVINLVPDKRRVFGQIYRVLRSPGGRFSISDIVTYGDVPQSIREDINQWTGCIAGALDREDYLQLIRDAGFVDVKVNASVDYDYLKGDDYGISSITVEGYKV